MIILLVTCALQRGHSIVLTDAVNDRIPFIYTLLVDLNDLFAGNPNTVIRAIRQAFVDWSQDRLARISVINGPGIEHGIRLPQIDVRTLPHADPCRI
jgi:hypothetical protein